MERYTIQEFAEICGGISYNGADKKIDGLIKKVKEGKLTGEIERNEELIEGKLTKVVYVSSDLLQLVKKDKNEPNSTQFNQVKQHSIEPNVTNSQQLNEPNATQFNSIEQLNNQFNPNEIINSLIQEVKTLAFQAGTAKDVPLLTNDLHYNREMVNKLNGDVAHWQKEFFALESKYNKLEMEFNQLELKVKEYDSKKSFLGFIKK